MADIIAGIAVFPTGAEEYDVSISLISLATGSLIGNKSSSSPVKLASLSETVESMISSAFPEPRMIRSYLTSVPPGFPADRYYEVFNALKSAKLVEHDEDLVLPLNHGEAFAMSLPLAVGKTTTLLTLDFCSPYHLYAASISSTEEYKERVNTIIHELSVSFADNSSLQAALQRIIVSHEDPSKVPDQVVLIKPTMTPFDIDKLVANIYPHVPVSIATFNDIADSAASLAYANLRTARGYMSARYYTIAPVSVATTSGAAVLLARSSLPPPVDLSITLTNSVENQKSASVHLLVGNHRKAKDNLHRAVAVLDGLKPLPKGEARIKVSIKLSGRLGWREAAQVVVEQEGGPKKTFLFPHFLEDLPEEYDKYNISLKEELEEDVVGSEASDEIVMGKLPE